MADLKISQLTGATTPLAGTEVVPVVQSSTTKKVSVSNLTSGLPITPSSVVTTNSSAIGTTLAAWGASLKALQIGFTSGVVNPAPGYTLITENSYNTGTADIYLDNRPASTIRLYNGGMQFYSAPTGPAGTSISFTQRLDLAESTGNLTLNTGNLIQGTAAKGVNFTANTPAAGMTSQLLNWYEEGTWTPNQGAGLTVVGAFSSSGTYTRIGRQITVRGQVVGATSVAVNAAGTISSNLPYAAATTHAGSMFNAAIDVSGVVQVTSSSIVAATTIAATASITFTATYQV